MIFRYENFTIYIKFIQRKEFHWKDQIRILKQLNHQAILLVNYKINNF
jgi:hypothetical protein